MADITVDVDWQIMQATETPGIEANRFDQHRQGDQPIGPRPETPAVPPPETDGK